MIHSMQPIIKHLFQADTLEDVSRERIEAFVEEHPSFGVGHYLLSRKLRGEDIDRFTGEAQRTSLYFTNPFWLQWLLENTGNNGERVMTVATLPSLHEEERDRPAPELVTTPADEPIRDEEPPFVLEEIGEVVAPSTEPASVEPASVEPVSVAAASVEPPQVEAALPAAASVEAIPQEESKDVLQEESREVLQEESREVLQEETMSSADQLMQHLREARELRESLMQINNDMPVALPQAEATPFTEATPVMEAIPATEPAYVEATPISEPAPIAEQLPDPVAPTPPPAVEATPVPEAAPDAGQPLVFEPYHTIDYFASQGIKLTLEENPSDALGKQLKSFTDWLKVMRKLPQKDRQMVPDIAAERTIQSIAAHSIEGKEVVTETMAEVLVKQGMPAKAREVYRKLSLLNPDKYAYFAAKIEQLKTD